MRVSVVLCTYNGAQYLPAQLQSYRDQTRPPDELIVVDDRSTDTTRQIVSDFAQQASFEVCPHVNPHNLGYAKNFARGLSLATGDILFLSDQDDVWHPEKIETVLRAFDDPHIQAAACDATLVDAELRPLGQSLWQSQGMRARHWEQIHAGQAFEVLAERNLIAGMTLAISRPLLKEVGDIPTSWVHDGWICLVAAAHNALAFEPKSLVEYRQHANNAIGVAPTDPLARLKHLWTFPRKDIETRNRQLKEAVARLRGTVASRRLEAVEAQIRHRELRSRIAPARHHRVLPILEELVAGGYHRHAGGFGTAVLDLIRPSVPEEAP